MATAPGPRINVYASLHQNVRETFRDEIAERDGGRCVLIEADAVDCDTVHLLTHSKGDEYISTHTQHRSRDTNGGDIIKDIDSIRNGLFLNKIVHERLDEDLTLVTPNFAMNTDDIDVDVNQQRGSPLQIFHTPEYLHAILFDIVYASTVIHHFGTPAVKDGIDTAWNNTYSMGVMTAENIQNRAQECEARRIARENAREGLDPIDMIAILPFFMVPLACCDERSQSRRRRRSRDVWRRRLKSRSSKSMLDSLHVIPKAYFVV
ncbi:hypothetical protein BJY52DRAFT_1415142 [Lactarius psammicola]|nr:hypothetical protein BJY52DRAFT_1415142 [Lactarius psammicola]